MDPGPMTMTILTSTPPCHTAMVMPKVALHVVHAPAPGPCGRLAVWRFSPLAAWLRCWWILWIWDPRTPNVVTPRSYGSGVPHLGMGPLPGTHLRYYTGMQFCILTPTGASTGVRVVGPVWPLNPAGSAVGMRRA